MMESPNPRFFFHSGSISFFHNSRPFSVRENGNQDVVPSKFIHPWNLSCSDGTSQTTDHRQWESKAALLLQIDLKMTQY